MKGSEYINWAFLLIITFIGIYVSIEATFQVVISLKPGVAIELAAMGENAKKHAMSVREFAKQRGHTPLLGWGQKFIYNIHEPENKESAHYTIVFLGDSVTAGIAL